VSIIASPFSWWVCWATAVFGLKLLMCEALHWQCEPKDTSQPWPTVLLWAKHGLYSIGCGNVVLEIDWRSACANSVSFFTQLVLSPFSCYKRVPRDVPLSRCYMVIIVTESIGLIHKHLHCGTESLYHTLPFDVKTLVGIVTMEGDIDCRRYWRDTCHRLLIQCFE
jgi:hypothetical protein